MYEEHCSLEGNKLILSRELWLKVLRVTGVKSKKRRIQKKVVKRLINKVLRQFIEDNGGYGKGKRQDQ